MKITLCVGKKLQLFVALNIINTESKNMVNNFVSKFTASAPVLLYDSATEYSHWPSVEAVRKNKHLEFNCFAVALHILVTKRNLYIVTPWFIFHLEKQTVAHPVNKYTLPLWNSKVHYCVHVNPPLDPILGHMNPVYIMRPYCLEVHIDICYM
jgi:hypothetical protein